MYVTSVSSISYFIIIKPKLNKRCSLSFLFMPKGTQSPIQFLSPPLPHAKTITDTTHAPKSNSIILISYHKSISKSFFIFLVKVLLLFHLQLNVFFLLGINIDGQSIFNYIFNQS